MAPGRNCTFLAASQTRGLRPVCSRAQTAAERRSVHPRSEYDKRVLKRTFRSLAARVGLAGGLALGSLVLAAGPAGAAGLDSRLVSGVQSGVSCLGPASACSWGTTTAP